jgi:hypothetical protein
LELREPAILDTPLPMPEFRGRLGFIVSCFHLGCSYIYTSIFFTYASFWSLAFCEFDRVYVYMTWGELCTPT